MSNNTAEIIKKYRNSGRDSLIPLLQESHYPGRSHAAMSTRGLDGIDQPPVTPTLQRRLADADGLGDLLGSEEVVHGEP